MATERPSDQTSERPNGRAATERSGDRTTERPSDRGPVLFLWMGLCTNFQRMELIHNGWRCDLFTHTGGYPCDDNRLNGIVCDSEVLTICMVLPLSSLFLAFPSLLSTRSLDAVNVYLACVGMAQTFLSLSTVGWRASHFATWVVAARTHAVRTLRELRPLRMSSDTFSMFEYLISDTEGNVSYAFTSSRVPIGMAVVFVSLLLETMAQQAAEAVGEARRLSPPRNWSRNFLVECTPSRCTLPPRCALRGRACSLPQ